ncbi:MAG: cell division protein FtsZ [Dictyoglomus sp. NZ13-RE01]|nr:MAG: cell division protein FtsZ [Dictyoglomus sp. NZ13-RE01]
MKKIPVIKVVGVGGAGGNAINRMIDAGVHGVEFIAVNTDVAVLQTSKAPIKIQIGAELTKGLGAGGDPKIAEKAALESEEIIREYLQGADMVFITAGMGGGTGTGASPVIADIARECADLVVAVVTLPFSFELRKKRATAKEGVERLKEKVDSVIIINNDKLLQLSDRNLPVLEAFKLADDVLRQAVQGVSEIVNGTGIINIDFNDLKSIMSKAGTAYLGIGVGKGENRAKEAAKMALNSPILDISINGAKGVIFNITCGKDFNMNEINELAEMIIQNADPEANVKFGLVANDEMEGAMKVTIVATGFEQNEVFKEVNKKEIEQNYAHLVGDFELPPFLLKQQNNPKDKR